MRITEQEQVSCIDRMIHTAYNLFRKYGIGNGFMAGTFKETIEADRIIDVMKNP